MKMRVAEGEGDTEFTMYKMLTLHDVKVKCSYIIVIFDIIKVLLGERTCYTWTIYFSSLIF